MSSQWWDPALMEGRKGYCQGNEEKCARPDGGAHCPLFGTLLKPSRDGRRRVKGCGDPVARGLRNKRKGYRGGRKAQRGMGATSSLTSHEENWGGPVRLEVKSGKQVNPVWTRFQAAENQSNAAKAVGDNRPFAFVAMPDGTSDGLVVMRLSEWEKTVRPLLEESG